MHSIGCYPVTWHLAEGAPGIAWITSPTYRASDIEARDYSYVVLPRVDYRAELNAPLLTALKAA
jgi:hypothetical protein